MGHNQGDQYSQREKRERKGQKVHLQKLWLKTFLTMGGGGRERHLDTGSPKRTKLKDSKETTWRHLIIKV